MIREINKLKKLGYSRDDVENKMLCDRIEKFFKTENNFLKMDYDELKKTINDVLDVVFVEDE
jgi:predicted ATP-dependent Lon-type protease